MQHAQIPTTDTKDVPMITNLSKLGVNVVNVSSTFIRGDPFITFAERGRGGGYPKANVVREVA